MIKDNKFVKLEDHSHLVCTSYKNGDGIII